MLASAKCNNSISSYLLTSLFLSPPYSPSSTHVRNYHSNNYRSSNPPINNRDYTKTLHKKKARDKEEQEEESKKKAPLNPFLRKRPLFSPKKKRYTTLPEPYKFTQSGFVKKREYERKLIQWDLVAKNRREKEEFKQQKNAKFTSETLPATLSSQQIADLITSQKKMSRSLTIFKEARKAGLAKNGNVYAALVTKLCDFEQPLHALNMIEECESLQEVHTDLPAKAFVKAVGEKRAVEMVTLARKMMVKENILPLCSTYVTFVKILSTVNRPYAALDIVQEMESSNVKLDEHSYHALAILFRQTKLYDKVRIVLNKMAFSYQITHAKMENLKPDDVPNLESTRLDKESSKLENARAKVDLESSELGMESNTLQKKSEQFNKESEQPDKGNTRTQLENQTSQQDTHNTNNIAAKTIESMDAKVEENENITNKDNFTVEIQEKTENTGKAQNNTTETDKEGKVQNNTQETGNTEEKPQNTKETRKHKPYLLLKTHELDKLILKNALKEKQDEFLKKV